MISPPFLKAGSKVAITAPASKVELEHVQRGIEILTKEWGLEVIVGKTVGNSYFNFSETDSNKILELQSFLDDPSISLIIAARGGYGCSRFIDDLNFEKFVENPKWIVGFSDITVFLTHIFKMGIQSIHGPMVKTMSFDIKSNDYLKNALFGDFINYQWKTSNLSKLGNAIGVAIGGNLCLMAHLIGSQSEPVFDKSILFLEEVSEPTYNIDRMMVQLERAGVFSQISGLVVGDFTKCVDNSEPFGKNFQEIILSHISKYNIPIAFDFPFGHENVNYSIKMGEMLELKVNSQFSSLKPIEIYEQV